MMELPQMARDCSSRKKATYPRTSSIPEKTSRRNPVRGAWRTPACGCLDVIFDCMGVKMGGRLEFWGRKYLLQPGAYPEGSAVSGAGEEGAGWPPAGLVRALPEPARLSRT